MERVLNPLNNDIDIRIMQSERLLLLLLTFVIRWSNETMNGSIFTVIMSNTDNTTCYPAFNLQDTFPYCLHMADQLTQMTHSCQEMMKDDKTVCTVEESFPRFSVKNGSFDKLLSIPRHFVIDVSLICSSCQLTSYRYKCSERLIKTRQNLNCILYTNPTQRDTFAMLTHSLRNVVLYDGFNTSLCIYSDEGENERNVLPEDVMDIHNCFVIMIPGKTNSQFVKTNEITLQSINIENSTAKYDKARLDKFKKISMLILILIILITCRIYIHLFDNSYGKNSGNLDYSKEYNSTDSKTFCYRFPMLHITSKSNLPYTQTLLDDFPLKSYDIESRLFNTTLQNIPQEIVLYPITGSLNGYLERVQDNEKLSRDDEMCYEVRRFQSFNPIRVAASPLRLAQSGFYATGREDETRCYSCGATHRKWELFDRPDMVHRRLSPGCPHLTSGDTRNIPMTSQSDDSSDRIVGVLQDYPKDTLSNSNSNTPSATLAAASASAPSLSTSYSTTLDIASAVYPQYKDRGSRLESYKGWRYANIQTPENLAEAGFYYAGYRDCVRCFYCGVGLKTWEEQDDPWVMHVRWRSSCDYVRHVRGEQFIQHALSQDTPVMPEDQPQSSPQPMTLPSRPVTNELIVKAEEMGFQREDIDKAIGNLAGTSEELTAQGNVTLETLLEKLILMTSADYTSGHRIEDGHIANGQHSRMTPHHSTQTQMGLSETILSMTSPFNEALSTETLPRSRTSASHTNLKSIQHNTDLPTSNGLNFQEASEGSSQTSRNSNAENETRVNSQDEERRLAEENESLREESTCKICMDNPCCIVFLPCGHLVTCAECAPALRRCPICRSYIRGSVRVQTTHRQ